MIKECSENNYINLKKERKKISDTNRLEHVWKYMKLQGITSKELVSIYRS